MCFGPAADLQWHLDEDGNAWRLTVQFPRKPVVDLSPESVRLEEEDALVLHVPEQAQPLHVNSARCSFSEKRHELVVRWPRASTRADAEHAERVSTADARQSFEAQACADGEASLQASTQDALETNSSSSSDEWVAVSSVPSNSESEYVMPARTASSGAASREPAISQDDEPPTICVEVSTPPLETPVVAPSKSAEEWKQLGNDAVKAGDHGAALERYSAGLAIEPDHVFLLSNRALALHTLGRLEDSLTDAKRCIALRPDFVKGYLRSAKILRELGRPQEALEVLRRAPLHDEVENLSAEVKPEAEAAEERRIEALEGAERKKEEGNALFKKGLFEQALPVYNEALACCADPVGEIAIAIRNNRAGCYHQLSNFERVVEDTTFVLQQQPDNLKALMRRMLALEPLEKYEAALQDARIVLQHIPGHDAANRLQHRLSRLVREQAREKSRA